MIECPYCEHQNDHDGESYKEDHPYQMECRECENNFIFRPHHDVTFDAEKADCLNGSDHKWFRTITFPRAFSKMICDTCGEKRSPTTEEMIEHKIPTMEEYKEQVRTGLIS